jgi:hypothetical protein
MLKCHHLKNAYLKRSDQLPASLQRFGSTMATAIVDQALNPILATVKPSKTIVFTDMATQMKEHGIDVSTLPVHKKQTKIKRKKLQMDIFSRF